MEKNIELMPLLLQGKIKTLPFSDALVVRLFEDCIDHCVTDAGMSILESDFEKLKEFEVSHIDDHPVDNSTGIGYEIDEDTWKTLINIHEGNHEKLDELHIQWLSEAGLLIRTESGRLILTEDTKTWISSKS
jgi:hypothetical protein